MYLHHSIGSHLAREHHRDMVARAEHMRTLKLLAASAAVEDRQQSQPRLRRILRVAVRLRLAPQA